MILDTWLGAVQRNSSAKNPRLLWKWVGGSRSHSDFVLFFENHPKTALNQYRHFGVVYHMYSVCIHVVKTSYLL